MRSMSKHRCCICFELRTLISVSGTRTYRRFMHRLQLGSMDLLGASAVQVRSSPRRSLIAGRSSFVPHHRSRLLSQLRHCVRSSTASSISCATSFGMRSEEHTSELQSRENLVCRLLLEKKKKN